MALRCIYFPADDDAAPSRILIEPPLKRSGEPPVVLYCNLQEPTGGDLTVPSSSIVMSGDTLLINAREDAAPVAYTVEHVGWLTQDAYEELEQAIGQWDQLAANSSDTFDPEDSNCEGARGNDYPSTPTDQESGVEEWD